MKAFEYANPDSIEKAVALLSKNWGDTEVLAGGTDLLTSMKQDVTRPSRVVSLKNIKGLRGIAVKGGAIEIGATTSLGDFAANAEVRKNFPALVTVTENIGSQQILNMGTIGGDLLQRPRCWFFRQGFGVLGQDGGKSLARAGDNRYHAVFGNKGPAYFVHPSSLAPGLIALGATISVQGSGGERSVAAAEFFRTPKKDSERESVLEPNEILTKISIPINGLSNGAYEIRQRRGLDWPMVAAAVAYNKGGDGTVVLGHVAPVPWVSDKASKALSGAKLDDATIKKIGAAAAQGASPMSDNGYKVHQIKVAVARAIRAAEA